MAGEALQILNLSPIPELSEVELSNVLEQFSELSELTGDLTDRNVEDILREAEELLDMFSSVKEMSEEIQNDDSKANEELEIKVQETNLSDEKKSEDKVMESPEQPLSARLISPSSSKNHIKSTIDSLKECSKIIEDQINSKTDCKKEEKHAKSNKNLPSYDVPTKINKVFTRLTSPVQKQSKNLSIPGKQKHIERLSKTANVRKTFNDFKSGPSNSVCKNKLQSKGIIEKRKKSPFCSPTQGSPIELQKNKHYECLDFKYGDENEIDFEKCIALLDKELLLGKNDSKFAEQLLKDSKESVSMLQKEIADLKAQLLKNTVRDRNSELEQTFRAQKDLISSLKEENTKLFQEIKEIKGQMRITENLEKTLKDKQDVIENLRSEIESLRDCVMSKANSSPGLSRLEERFQVIKDKYNQQIEKLELENQQLKHALNHPHVEHDNDFSHNQDSEEKLGKEIGVQTEISPVLKPTKLIRSTSFENWRSGKPKLWDNVRSLENGNGEAICQTERETRNASVQSEEISAPKEKKIPADHVLEPRKIDNKENMVGKPPKPNLDRKKGMSEHELHLMATLRGLHAEILAKDKENRKLKNELDTLKNQTKKLGGDAGKKKTVQSKKKIHAGTQTIGLGPCVPAAYDPALFQVSKELENENEELKAKIKALEEEGVQLKNKRISDLQILQEIHEQEMAKLESKLQSQTALAKHLHTLLLNR